MSGNKELTDIEHFKFFSNRECEYFPCHKTDDPNSFNCLFCFCPAYSLGRDCGGNFLYDNEDGIKDCRNCIIPHQPDSYGFMVEKAKIIVQKTKQK